MMGWMHHNTIATSPSAILGKRRHGCPTTDQRGRDRWWWGTRIGTIGSVSLLWLCRSAIDVVTTVVSSRFTICSQQSSTMYKEIPEYIHLLVQQKRWTNQKITHHEVLAPLFRFLGLPHEVSFLKGYESLELKIILVDQSISSCIIFEC